MFSCIFVHILTYYLYVFCRENGGGGGGGSDRHSLQFILFLLHGLCAPASTPSSLTSSYMDVLFTVQPPSG